MRLSFGVEQPVPEFQELMRLEEAGLVKIPGPRSEAELTYRRRLRCLPIGWVSAGAEAGQNSIQITGILTGRLGSWGRGRLGGSNPAELQSRCSPFLGHAGPALAAYRACWRTGIKVDGAKSLALAGSVGRRNYPQAAAGRDLYMRGRQA